MHFLRCVGWCAWCVRALVAAVVCCVLVGCCWGCCLVVLCWCAIVWDLAVWVWYARWGSLRRAGVGGLVHWVCVVLARSSAHVRFCFVVQVLCVLLCDCAGEVLWRWSADVLGVPGAALGAECNAECKERRYAKVRIAFRSLRPAIG